MTDGAASAVPRTPAEWVRAVADRAGLTVPDVQAILDRHGIEPRPTLPRARTLVMRSVAFSGTKDGTGADGPFAFERMDLGRGLWAMMSDRNSRGKSSVLNVVRAAVRGDFPGPLKPDVWRWIGTLEVAFDIDAVGFRILVEKEPGEERAERARVRLGRRQGDDWIDLYDGPAGPGLETQVEALFMEELGFARFHAFNAPSGTGHTHGWAAISAGLFVTGPGRAIFGDLVVDAMPLRLLQLFMGLPWISTYTAAQTALKQAEAEATKKKAEAERPNERLRERLAAVQRELGEERGRLEGRPDRAALRASLGRLDVDLVRHHAEEEAARARLGALRLAEAEVEAASAEARIALQQLTDEAAAGHLFRRLRPVCCPSCEAGIAPGRYAASEVSGCALCGSVGTPAADETEDRAAAARADVADCGATARRVAAEIASEDGRMRLAAEARRGTEARIASVRTRLAEPEESDLELRIAALEAREAELRSLLPEDGAAAAEAPDVPVLRATAAVTKELFEGLQRETVADLSAALLRICRDIGVENLADMTLAPHGALSVHQGGSRTTFSQLSPGENLRVRIAAALAVVEVARLRGYGRHPGLLVLDSPAAQEMSTPDFAALLARVQAVVADAPGIQVLVGAVARPELTAVVPRERCRHAEGLDYLF